MEVFGVGGDVEESGEDFALLGGLGDMGGGVDPVGGVVVGGEFAQLEDAALGAGGDFDDFALGVGRGDGVAGGPEVEAVDGFVVLAHVVVALGAAVVVVEGDAGADDVDERGALVRDGSFDEGHELLLVAGEAARDEGGAHEEREADGVDGGIRIDGALLRLRALVGGGGELALGKAVDAVVLEDVGHVDAAAHDVGELPQADGSGVAVAGDADVGEVAVGEVCAGQHRGHAPVHGVEAVRLAEEVVRGLGGAADAGELGDAVRLDVELPEGLDQRGGDGVVPAAGAERGDLALVVAARVAGGVLDEGRVVEFGFGEIGHKVKTWVPD